MLVINTFSDFDGLRLFEMSVKISTMHQLRQLVLVSLLIATNMSLWECKMIAE